MRAIAGAQGRNDEHAQCELSDSRETDFPHDHGAMLRISWAQGLRSIVAWLDFLPAPLGPEHRRLDARCVPEL